jgi:hypothetical protein
VAGLVIGGAAVFLPFLGVVTLAAVVAGFLLSFKGKQEANAGAGGNVVSVIGMVVSGVGALLYLLVGVLTLGVGFFI